MTAKQRKRNKADENVKKDGRNTESSSSSSSQASPVNVSTGSRPSTVTWKRLLTRAALSVILMGVFYYSARKKVDVFAPSSETLKVKALEVPCSKDYVFDAKLFPDCIPKKCGRIVSDVLITPDESLRLLMIAKKALAQSPAAESASIFDLHSGAIAHGNTTVLLQRILQAKKMQLFDDEDFHVYSRVKNKMKSMISFQFGVPLENLHLTYPTFFSEMTKKDADQIRDEYWHVHVDKTTYESFAYTSLLYLADYGKDFTGGRFVFVDKGGNSTVEPRIGRVIGFTSGSENTHHVEKVASGIRYALTVPFSCDPSKAIAEPSPEKFKV